ncbi:uncharacterized protein DNG_05435 [Cephalotrichum gorgonifer]|uniref:DUF2428 domain-containing protein n=1 Tax=Cephalotrichum gorgonifer TaxID=2041049 RepID=A0AAE8SVG5_9PEZI|nr:uncharacterized protein DNG_05435 [Cephalotrichum gorgonifer]
MTENAHHTVSLSEGNKDESPRDLVKLIEDNPLGSQAAYAKSVFNHLISQEASSKAATSKIRVKLCGFIQQCCQSRSGEVKDWAFSNELYLKLMDLYLEWNESDSERSLRLVLDLLVDLMTGGQSRADRESTKLTVLDTLVSIVARQSARPLAKSAMMVLDRFLSKSVVSLHEVGSKYKELKRLDIAVSDLQLWKTYVAEILNWMKVQFVCPVAGKFVATIYKGLHTESEKGFLSGSEKKFTVELWHEWLLQLLIPEPLLLEGVKNYILLPLFKLERTESLAFLDMMNRLDRDIVSPQTDLDTPAMLKLASLEVGKRVGLVEEPVYAQSGTKRGGRVGPVVLQEDLLEHVLVHPSYNVRTLALSLIVSSSSTTRPYSPTALVLLKRHLGMYFADSEARFRNELLSKLRDMYKRIRGGIFVLRRSLARARATAVKKESGTADQGKPALYHTNIISHSESELSSALKLHEDFLRWYIHFLRTELTPTASYQRHATSLKATSVILQLEAAPTKTWETEDDGALLFDLFDPYWSRMLLDLLVDPFDDVRDIAAMVLRLLLSDDRYQRILPPGRDRRSILSEFLSKANQMANQTGREDHANGVARAYELLHRFSGDQDAQFDLLSELLASLGERISSAEANLGSAVLDAPTHGLFAALSYIVLAINENPLDQERMGRVNQLYLDIVGYCSRIWDVVRVILCDDSPEGHLPDDLDEMEGLDTKNLLSYSFRAIDESSKVMKAIVLGAKRYVGKGQVCPSKEVFSAIGGLSFQQLSTLRHRGALTAASQTFAAACQMSGYYSGDDSSGSLLSVWYQRSTTRRSAGIPAMMIGVLSANSEITLEQALSRLMEIATMPAEVTETDGSNLPQVHALNSLTAIFKTSYLSHFEKKLEKYIPLCLQLAADCLKSKVWAIRNCGLLLLRGLMDSLFGTSESKSTMEAGWDGTANCIDYDRYPSLAPVLLSLLKSGRSMVYELTTIAAAEAVFPALDIIRRAGPPASQRDELQTYVAEYLGSPAWHVREIAARTLCSCMLHSDWLPALRSLLSPEDIANPERETNRFHGALLTGRFLVERLSEVMPEELEADFQGLVSLLKDLRTNRPQQLSGCPDLYAAYVGLLNQAAQYGLYLSRRAAKDAESMLNNLLISPTKSEEMADAGHHGALLRLELAVQSVYGLYQEENIDIFLRKTREMVDVKVSSLVATLEALPQIWPAEHLSESMIRQLFDLYRDVCVRSSGAESRAIALRNLTDLMVDVRGRMVLTPSRGSLEELWANLQRGSMSPSLSDEIVRVAGAMLGYLLSAETEGEWNRGDALRRFAALIAESSTDDQHFDTRYSAAESLKFALRTPPPVTEEYLPIRQALYTLLNDDDPEIRLLAAEASSPHPVIPLQAATALLSSLSSLQSRELAAAAACRITGCSFPVNDPQSTIPSWVPSDAQLEEATKLDTSLFAVEAQNLFVDPAREAERWRVVLSSCADDEVLSALAEWTAPGLKALGQLMSSGDGVLGWSSSRGAHAVAVRIVLCSMVLAQKGCPGFEEGFRGLGEGVATFLPH